MIRLGLYGCGRRTQALLDALWKDEFYTVTRAFDANKESAVSLVKKYAGSVCDTAEELLAAKDVDAFLISLSPLAHAEVLKSVIPVGKPIFIEKPVGFTGQEVFDLALLAEKYSVPVQVGFMRRYLPSTLEALDYIKQHDGGRLLSVDCNWFHHGATEMNHCLWQSPDNFRMKVSQIPFHCCHMLDIMLLVGGDVKKVSALTTKVIDRPYPSPDDLIANIEFAGGTTGRFHYSSMVHYGEMSYRFHFENYSLRLEMNSHNLQINTKPRFHTSEWGPRPEDPSTNFAAQYEKFAQPRSINYDFDQMSFTSENIMYDFVKTVRDGAPVAANLRTAAKVQGFAEAMELSGKLGGKVIELDENGIPLK